MAKMALASVLFGILAYLAGTPAPAGEVFTLDKTVPFPKTGIGTLGFQAGPIVLEEIVIRNMPDEADIAKSKSDPDDSCHPKLAVGMSNSGPSKMKVRIVVRLEGDNGSVYMSCDRDDTVEPGANNDHTNLCWLTSMKTKDFPKVTKVHITASVSPDR